MNHSLQYMPDVLLLAGLLAVILLDFIIGVTRATLQGNRRTSKGFWQTIIKFLQYGSCIIISIVILNIVSVSGPGFGPRFSQWFGNTMLCFMIYIEVVSIFENMEALAPGSLFVKYFVRPVRRMITLQLRHLLRDEGGRAM